MKILTTTSLAAVLVAATAFGQSAKPSPYQGVSHPPDDAIVTNDLTPTPPASTDSPAATDTVTPLAASRPLTWKRLRPLRRIMTTSSIRDSSADRQILSMPILLPPLKLRNKRTIQASFSAFRRPQINCRKGRR